MLYIVRNRTHVVVRDEEHLGWVSERSWDDNRGMRMRDKDKADAVAEVMNRKKRDREGPWHVKDVDDELLVRFEDKEGRGHTVGYYTTMDAALQDVNDHRHLLGGEWEKLVVRCGETRELLHVVEW
jgi:hypothetical protein